MCIRDSQETSLESATNIVTDSLIETISPDNTTLNSGSDAGSAIAEMIIVHVIGLISPLEIEPGEVQSPSRLLSNCRVAVGLQDTLSLFSTSQV